jgi:hypothetical protein
MCSTSPKDTQGGTLEDVLEALRERFANLFIYPNLYSYYFDTGTGTTFLKAILSLLLRMRTCGNSWSIRSPEKIRSNYYAQIFAKHGEKISILRISLHELTIQNTSQPKTTVILEFTWTSCSAPLDMIPVSGIQTGTWGCSSFPWGVILSCILFT